MHAISKHQLAEQLRDARQRTLDLVDGLDYEQLMGPRNLSTINPLPWEIGHTAYFHELWCLRHRHHLDSFLDNSDELFDSINIAHDTRWELPVPPLAEIKDYMGQVLEKEIDLLQAENESQEDVSVPACDYQLGARPEDGFCFDNEKWAHEVRVEDFEIARAPVTNQQYLEFVEAGGYTNIDYWDEAGWSWRQQHKLNHPVYWRKGNNGWQTRLFDHWQPLAEHQPVIHVSWHEAQAWCRWAGRRLPTEAEWELAASGPEKRSYPWGEALPDSQRVNMDSRTLGCIDVAALPGSDSIYGCRQMIGNVWEWTDTTFAPYPGFTPDMYDEYSTPLFNITRVLRGGAWPTRSRMIRNTWRNYYGPDRNDVFSGFRTCKI